VAKSKEGQAHPAFATKRLRLRQCQERDVEGLHACFGDPEAMRYWNFPPCKTRQDSERWVKYLAKATNPYASMAWAVADKRTDKCIGMVNYHHREAHNRRLEIGYILAPARQGRGLMAEAVRAVLGHCFDSLAVHRVQALIHPDNTASIRLVERLGFSLEGGPLRDYWRVGDVYMSVLMYALLAKGGE
jgi:[ribosomal protein S5]-alanine N-acetyltransferase